MIRIPKRYRTTATAVVLLACLVQPASALDYGKGTIKSEGTFGCKELKVFDRIIDLHGSGDKAAARKLQITSLLTGDCAQLPVGQVVFIEDITAWGYTNCVRPEGSTECLWTAKIGVEKNKNGGAEKK